jgi:hypothetical protein
MKHRNAGLQKNAKIISVAAGGVYSFQWDLKCYRSRV